MKSIIDKSGRMRWSRLRAGAIGALCVAVLSTVVGPSVNAVTAPVGQGFTLTPADLAFMLKQIKIAESHAATLTPTNPCGTLVATPGDGIDDALQIPDRLTAYGLRTVDGSCNNLFPGRETFAAADQPFPRLTNPVFRPAETTPAGFGPPTQTSYAQKKGLVFDSQPRVISNLIVDQTSTNPAAVDAALNPVRTQGNEGVVACTTDPDPAADPPVAAVPAGCVPSHQTLFIPNVTTDVGLSPPYNSLFTFFGQFFDHGVDQTVKSGGTVFVPLHADDPLVTLGPDGKPNTGDEVPANQAFMVLTRAQNQPGPDGVLGDNPATPGDESADDIQNANNTDSPWVDQSQTYTSHPSHQVFLREYVNNTAGRPVSTGKLLGGQGTKASGMATWASVKAQAATLLGLKLADVDVTNIPMIATDPYGKFIPGPARGLPQYVTKTGLVEGNTANPVPVPANVIHFDTPFLTDIAHNADPSPVDTDNNPATPPVAPTPDADNVASADFANQPPGTYDDEMLNAHFCAGDGRVNENIALTTVHQIFHSEHDRLVDYIKDVLTNDTSSTGQAALPEWQLGTGAGGWNGERLFQAARFVTEMEYQHLVFEEFARKIQPAIRPFHVYHPDINPAVQAEFAHAVYRFGHSMLDDTVARTNENGSDNSVPLLTAFLNPPEYYNDGSTPGVVNSNLTPEQAAGAIVMGSSDQIGNELDEFVAETLRNNLLGLPLDLPTLNMTRARDAGIPPLNDVRRQIFQRTNDGQLAPYTDWSDFGQHLKHPQSLINFVAAYGKHPSITSQSTLAGKRAAARAIVNPQSGDVPPDDAADFMYGTGAWANTAGGVTTTGLDEVDLWVGGLAEITNLFGGLLGSTFNYVFQTQLESLQDGDRLYYLARTPGMNLRTQLEGNSFAELIQRNTDGTNTLKADAFATADCKFQLGHLTWPAPAGSFITGAGSVADDLTTPDCNENRLLLRKADGTIQYRQFNSVDPSGINGQSVYNGTSGADRVFGGNDNDTFWGGAGNDIIEGNGGDDVALGGDGNDIITDLGGADTEKGGPGNDALDGGIGDDIFMGGDGQDFINGGANDNETFAGPGNDFIIAGQGADAVFGDGGDDWIQGGSGQDLLQGDHGAPFFDDPAQVKPGNDIFVGQVGENDYDAEGGDDIMSQNAAIDRNAGAGGFDWAIHQYDTVGADDDMEINNNLVGVPIQVVVNRDRWQETEANSGSAFNDVIRGTSDVPAAIGGAGFTGCDVLDQAGINRIAGLAAILPPVLTGDPAPVVANSAAGFCPITGPIWGEGNILLGGAGSDTLEGRGANDILDGDRALSVRISVRTNPADPASEIGSTDLMEHQYLRDGNGALIGPTLQAAVFAGTVDPGNLVAVREITSPAPGTDSGSIDTAVFSGPRADYDITFNTGSVTVNHARGTATDGIDTLFNIEQLRFADQTVSLVPVLTATPASVAFGNQNLGTTSATQNVTINNPSAGAVPITGVTISGAGFSIAGNACPASLNSGASCVIGVRFSPVTVGGVSGSLVISTPTGGVNVPLSATGVGPPPVPTGLAATAPSSSQISMSWSPSVGAARYLVFRNGGATPVGNVTGTSFTDNGLAPDTVFTYTVVAQDALGGNSTPSAPVSARTRVVLSVNPAAADFGNVRFLGNATSSRTFTVTNNAITTQTVSTLPITGAAASEYRVTANGCANVALAPGGICTFTVQFNPNRAGTRTATLTVNRQSGGIGFPVILTGRGTLL